MSQSEAQSVIESAVQNQPKKRGCRRGCQGCLIALVILAVPFVWFNIPTPLRVSKETTYVLGPMTSDGKRIDYFRAMEERFYPPQMKTDENGYRMLVRAIGTAFPTERREQDPKTLEWTTVELDPEPLRIQVYEKLGLDPTIPPTLTLTCACTFIAHYVKDRPEERDKWSNDSLLRNPWTFADFPMLEDWLDENTEAIDLLGVAVREPVFRIPFVRENENTPIFDVILMGEVQMMRQWARAVWERANYRLGIGDVEGAIDDIVTLHHLGRHAGKHGAITSWFVGIAIEGMGYSIGIGSNPEFPPTKEQIERLIGEMDTLPPRPTLNEALESERMFALAAMQDQYWGNNPGAPLNKLPLFPFMGLTMDISTALSRLNKVHDALIDPEATIDGKTIDELLELSRQNWKSVPLFSKRSRTNQIMDQMIALFIPAMQAAREAEYRTKCTENLHRLTLALLLYELEHGQFPDGDWREALAKPPLPLGEGWGEGGETSDRAHSPHPNPLPKGEGTGKLPLGEGTRLTGVPAKYFRCPSHRGLAEDETTYAMIGGVPNAVSSPSQILLVEIREPQKLGEGDGRIPFEEAQFENGVPVKLIGSNHPGGINTGLRSGAVRFMPLTTNPGMPSR